MPDRSPRRGVALCAALVVLALTPARAQDTLAATGGPDGFRFRAADGRFELRLNTLAQGDARFFLGEGEEAGVDQFLFRRARFIAQAVAGRFAFRLVPDVGQGRLDVEEAWGEGRVRPALAVRAGQQKVPLGLEWLRSSTDLLFVERALPTALVPRSDAGFLLRGDLAGGRADYALGVFNGAPDGQSTSGDAGDGKDVAARVFARPFPGALAGLGLGLAASYGHESAGTPLPAYRTPAGRVIARYAASGNPAVPPQAAGRRLRVSPQATLLLGPVQAFGEYVASTQSVFALEFEAHDDLTVRAWQAAAGVMLTGERATLGRVRPAHPVEAGGLGAFELAARVHGLSVEEEAFPGYMSPAENARRATAFGLGVNWYPSAHAKVMLNVERTAFDAAEGGTEPPAELAVLGRMQVAI